MKICKIKDVYKELSKRREYGTIRDVETEVGAKILKVVVVGKLEQTQERRLKKSLRERERWP